jgi:hypothetical protein
LYSRKYGDVKMTLVYNVWVIVERIDESKNENGEDVLTEKAGKFRSEKQAVAKAKSLLNY